MTTSPVGIIGTAFQEVEKSKLHAKAEADDMLSVVGAVVAVVPPLAGRTQGR